MAKLLLSLSFLLVLCSFSFAAREGSWQQGECHISKINAQEPKFRLEAEGGVTEFWDHTSNEFRCAGVSIHRHRIQARGLMLPVYHNAPVLFYVLRGRGQLGLLLSGCPETFESSQESQQFEEERGQEEKSQRIRDQHQKVRQIRQGDIIAIPAGAAHWTYNNGEEELVTVAVQDQANYANQLDRTPRAFYLAGDPMRGQQPQQGSHGQSQHGKQYGQPQFGNVLKGIPVRRLAQVYGVDEETARLLRGEEDTRGHIVIVKRGLQIISPPLREEYGRQEEQYGGQEPHYNGLEETICSAKLSENLDKPSRADFYNPRAGRYSTSNSLTLPILKFIQLSAARGVLYRNAIIAPHWFANAHSLIYITRGNSRMQIVNHLGQAVFDGEVREEQVILVPQNFAVLKQAGEQGCEWIEFNTNDNAMFNTLSGRTSAFRAMPVDVIANAYQISREQAERLKYSRRETLLFSGSSSKYEWGGVASA